MKQPANTATVLPEPWLLFALPRARSFLTVVISTAALILACLAFAPSSVSWGALSGSLPFAAIIAIVGLGQLLVVQQGGFDLSLAGGVSLAVVISTHYPQGENSLLLTAVLMAIACAVLAGRRLARSAPPSISVWEIWPHRPSELTGSKQAIRS